MPQILHLGHFKTGSTGLQRLVFRQGPLPYHGINDGTPADNALRWVEELRSERLDPAWHRRDFVFSNESGLLRFGGREALDAAARGIVRRFADPHVLITVRDPARVLISAYVQSLRVRRETTGDLRGRFSYRFLPFDAWCRLLLRREHVSLAGLLAYADVADVLRRHLGGDRVTILPLELTGTHPGRYRAALVHLGFDAAAVDGFLRHPPVNSTTDRPLRRPAAVFHGLGRMPAFVDHPRFNWLHLRSEPVDLPAAYPATIAAIRCRYPYDPDALLGPSRPGPVSAG